MSTIAAARGAVLTLVASVHPCDEHKRMPCRHHEDETTYLIKELERRGFSVMRDYQLPAYDETLQNRANR